MKRKFRRILSEGAQKLWSERKEKIRRKKDHLAEKYRPKPKVDTIKGVKIGDEYMQLETQDIEKPLAWGVEIDEDEGDFLSLPASIADLPKLDVERMKTDIQAMASKIRREMNNNDGGKEPQDSQGMENEIEASNVFEPRSNTLDLGKQRVTDMKTCKRVHVPGPCKMEAKLQTLINQLEDVVEKAEADEKRRKVHSYPGSGCSSLVLTERQMKGKAKLLRRQSDGECVLCRTDKSGKLCVLSKELFIKKMLPHIENDHVVDREVVIASEKILNASCAQLARVMRTGRDYQHEDRVKSAITVSNSKIPALGQLLKDHKPEVIPGEGPVSRPVGYASEAPNGPLSDLTGKVLGPFIKEMNNRVKTEAGSTEDVKAGIQDVNEMINRNGMRAGPFQQAGNLVTSSLDFDAYFPSLDIEKCATLAEETIANSNVNINCDPNELALFIACSQSEESIEKAGLQQVVHKRRFNRGARPGMTCNAITGGTKARSDDKSWLPPVKEPALGQKMRMIGIMVGFCIRLTMSHHYYTFNGEIRRQSKGGATGNILTMELSRLLGLGLDGNFLKTLQNLGIQTKAYWRYVNDNTNILKSVDPGVRLVKDESNSPQGLEIQPELIEMDKMRPEDERTANLLSEVQSTHLLLSNMIFQAKI